MGRAGSKQLGCKQLETAAVPQIGLPDLVKHRLEAVPYVISHVGIWLVSKKQAWGQL